MRNIIDNSKLTSADSMRRCRESEGRRKRRAVHLSLVKLGSRVVSPAKNHVKSGRISEPRLDAPQRDGREVKTTSPRRLEQAWLAQHSAEYAGAWVALDDGKLLARGCSAREVLDAAKLEGYYQPLIVHIPSEPPLPFGGW